MLINDVPDTVQAQAEAIRGSAWAAYDSIRSRAELTADAISAQMASVYVDAKARLDSLAASASDQAAITQDTAMRQAFGSSASDPASVVSARDASDRAAQLDLDGWPAAMALLDQADMNRDEALARAVAARAYTLGVSGDGTWGSVLDRFVATRPAAARALNALANLQVRPTITSILAFVMAKPSELSALSEWQIAAKAAG